MTLTRAQAAARCAAGKHRLGVVPAARFRAPRVGDHGLALKYPHGALVCADCLLIFPARPGEIAGKPDIVNLWAEMDDEPPRRRRGAAVRGRYNHGGDHGSLRGRWARGWDACRECGTTDAPHKGFGYCADCYYELVTAPRNREKAARRAALRKANS